MTKQQHTPARLEAFAEAITVETESGAPVHAIAQEHFTSTHLTAGQIFDLHRDIAHRYNTHADLLAALESLVPIVDATISVMKENGWDADRETKKLDTARAAIKAAKEGR